MTFRSEDMTMCNIVFHTESAFNCVVELGFLEAVQFFEKEDNVESKRFVQQVQRCAELKRILELFQDAIDQAQLRTTFYPNVDATHIPEANNLKEYELILTQTYKRLVDVQEHYLDLLKQQNNVNEHLIVLDNADDFLSGSAGIQPTMAYSDSVMINLMNDGGTEHTAVREHRKLSYFTGVISIERFAAFELMLWRLLRGNFHLKHAEIPGMLEDVTKQSPPERKYAFMITFVGDKVRDKITKVCDGFHASLYECPEAKLERAEKTADLTLELANIQKITAEIEEERYAILSEIVDELYIYRVNINKIMAVYTQMNKFETIRTLENKDYLQARCWIPTSKVPDAHQALKTAAKRTRYNQPGTVFPPLLVEKITRKDMEQPTYFSSNKFTLGFQNLIDSYGIANYKELNPMPYTIITFPFLFSVMFGDLGHGLIMLLFGCWMVYYEKKLEEKQRMSPKTNEVFNILFTGRYVILLMGAFSIYAGIIYNDVFSKSFNIFGSHWHVSYSHSDIQSNKALQLDPASKDNYAGTPYWFGMDPAWKAGGQYSITTQNSVKMKLAIVLGVTQMVFGLCLQAANCIYSQNWPDLLLIFLPQIIFLLCLFFYLVFLIFYKWSNFGGHYESPYNTACAPSVLITFINMMLLKGAPEAPPGCNERMYAGQGIVELVLLFIAFLAIPVLLCGKPIFVMYQRRRAKNKPNLMPSRGGKRGSVMSLSEVLTADVPSRFSMFVGRGSTSDFVEPVQDHHMSEIWIHQGIHCIESVLGSVSHTASYLRLWALSLAHEQLSEVLWVMVLAQGLRKKGNLPMLVFTIFVSFSLWAVLTLAILVLMEGLSAFLHTLRLHWVEFQSKFYTGAGVLLIPFRFEKSTARS